MCSADAEQQTVGVVNAARLLCVGGDSSKAAFISAGGLPLLLRLARRKDARLQLIAATCNALLNLSSYPPIQVAVFAAITAPPPRSISPPAGMSHVVGLSVLHLLWSFRTK
jgi:hypothetical protein